MTFIEVPTWDNAKPQLLFFSISADTYVNLKTSSHVRQMSLCSFEIPQQYSESDAGNWLQVVCSQEGCSTPHPPLNSACKGETLNTQHQHQSRFQTFDNRCQSSISERISTITFVFLRNGQNMADNWLSARQLTVPAQTELRGAGEEITH